MKQTWYEQAAENASRNGIKTASLCLRGGEYSKEDALREIVQHETRARIFMFKNPGLMLREVPIWCHERNATGILSIIEATTRIPPSQNCIGAYRALLGHPDDLIKARIRRRVVPVLIVDTERAHTIDLYGGANPEGPEQIIQEAATLGINILEVTRATIEERVRRALKEIVSVHV